MPLDGSAPLSQPLRWTITVRLIPRLISESRHWPQRKRTVFERLAADALYAAIDSIQWWDLATRNERSRRRGSWISYEFKLELATRAILITISEFHFYDPSPNPDPDGGEQRMAPQGGLIVQVIGTGKEYRIERYRGFIPIPPKPAQNSIISPFWQGTRILGKPPFAHHPSLGNGNAANSTNGKNVNDGIYYSPRGWKIGSQINRDLAWLYEPSAPEVAPRSRWSTMWLRVLDLFRLSRAHAPVHRGDGYSLRSGKVTHSAAENAHAFGEAGKSMLSRLFSWTRPPRHSQPIPQRDPQ